MDHRALLVKMRGEPDGVKPYHRERCKIPKHKKTLPAAEQMEGEKMFQNLRDRVKKPEHWYQIDCQWIRPGT